MSTTANLNDVDLEAVVELVKGIQEEPEKAATVWRAEVRWNGGFRSQASIREFDPIPSDEPTGLGGSDTAPNPVEQVAAALGNCLAVGYVAALTTRGITVRSLDITVEGQLDLHAFLGLREGNAGYSGLEVDVRLEADTDDETLRAIHEQVVSTSPVGHTLQRPVPVEVRLNAA